MPCVYRYSTALPRSTLCLRRRGRHTPQVSSPGPPLTEEEIAREKAPPVLSTLNEVLGATSTSGTHKKSPISRARHSQGLSRAAGLEKALLLFEQHYEWRDVDRLRFPHRGSRSNTQDAQLFARPRRSALRGYVTTKEELLPEIVPRAYRPSERAARHMNLIARRGLSSLICSTIVLGASTGHADVLSTITITRWASFARQSGPKAATFLYRAQRRRLREAACRAAAALRTPRSPAPTTCRQRLRSPLTQCAARHSEDHADEGRAQGRRGNRHRSCSSQKPAPI